jgi:hypothetical protein
VAGEAEVAAAVDFGLQAAAFGAVGFDAFVFGALLAGLFGAVAVVDEALAEVGFGGLGGAVGGADLGDGGEGAEVGIEFEVLDDGGDLVGVRVPVHPTQAEPGWGARGGGISPPERSLGEAPAGCGVDSMEVEGGDVEAVEEEAGAFGVEGVGGDAGEDVGDGVLDDVGVLEGREDEDGVEGVLAEVFWGFAGGVVEVAEAFAAEGGGAAAAAGEVDVAAEVARGCVGHDGLQRRDFF